MPPESDEARCRVPRKREERKKKSSSAGVSTIVKNKRPPLHTHRLNIPAGGNYNRPHLRLCHVLTLIQATALLRPTHSLWTWSLDRTPTLPALRPRFPESPCTARAAPCEGLATSFSPFRPSSFEVAAVMAAAETVAKTRKPCCLRANRSIFLPSLLKGAFSSAIDCLVPLQLATCRRCPPRLAPFSSPRCLRGRPDREERAPHTFW